MKSFIGLDVETHLITQGCQTPPVVCLSYSGESVGTGVLTGDDIEAFLLEAFTSDACFIGQNFAFDAACLLATYPTLTDLLWDVYLDGRIYDTLMAERLIDIAIGMTRRPKGYYTLDSIASRYDCETPIDKSSVWRTRYSELEETPIDWWPREALLYAAYDSQVLPEVQVNQIKTATNFYSSEKTFIDEVSRQSGYALPLYLMRVRGVCTDIDRVKTTSTRLHTQIEEATVVLKEHGIIRANNSCDMTRVRERIESHLADPPLTPTGKTATSKAAIELCNDKILTLHLERKANEKLISTYLSKLERGVVHPSFNVLGAATGRTSCSRPNLQNQPRSAGIRECFIPREGFVFAFCDYDTQELRTFAQACLAIVGFSKLADMYQKDRGFDPHSFYASEFVGIDYEGAIERKNAGDPEFKGARQKAKAINFGIPGGLGIAKLIIYARNNYGIELSEKEAHDLKNRWLAMFPEAKAYFQHVSDMTREGLVPFTQLYSNRVRGRVGYCDGANTYFQGLASDASKTAALLVANACYADRESALYGSHPVMLIHDELILEVPEETAHEAAAALEQCMLDAMSIWCPDVPAQASPVLARRWSKSAEPAFRDDRLIPWEDRAG